jgi:hypothetical protein
VAYFCSHAFCGARDLYERMMLYNTYLLLH